MDGVTCKHKFTDEGTAPFLGSDGGRFCSACKYIEVRIGRRWISFDEYLERRRSQAATLPRLSAR